MSDPPFDEDMVLNTVVAARRAFDPEDLSPTGTRASAILDRVLAVDSAPPMHAGATSQVLRRRGRGSRWRPLHPGVALSVSVAAITALVLILAGAFSGPARTGTLMADAAVLRHVASALDPRPGTILIEKSRVEYTSRNGHVQHFGLERATETPDGPGPQNSLFVTTEPGVPNETATINGNEEIYLKRTNTIYISSNYGPDITNGPRPGTYLYTPLKPPAGPSATVSPKPLTLTAAQATALRSGSDGVVETLIGKRIPYQVQLRVAPVPRFPSETASIRDLLKRHALKVAGTTTVAGRPVIKLVGPRFNLRRTNRSGEDGVTYYVDPHTYTPIELIVDRPPLFKDSQIWTEYRTLPSTPVNERLLSLAARHPTVRIDHNRQDYIRAANGLAVSTG
jgi:hypothetical protein